MRGYRIDRNTIIELPKTMSIKKALVFIEKKYNKEGTRVYG